MKNIITIILTLSASVIAHADYHLVHLNSADHSWVTETHHTHDGRILTTESIDSGDKYITVIPEEDFFARISLMQNSDLFFSDAIIGILDAEMDLAKTEDTPMRAKEDISTDDKAFRIKVRDLLALAKANKRSKPIIFEVGCNQYYRIHLCLGDCDTAIYGIPDSEGLMLLEHLNTSREHQVEYEECFDKIFAKQLDHSAWAEAANKCVIGKVPNYVMVEHDEL